MATDRFFAVQTTFLVLLAAATWARLVATWFHRLDLPAVTWPKCNRKPQTLKRAIRQQAAYDKYGGWGEFYLEQDQKRLTYLRNKPSVPDRFKGKDIIDVCPPFLRLTSLQMAVLIEDDDAATGFAWALTSETSENTADHTPLPEFGISDVTTKFLDRQEIPEDEDYHWYKAGTFKASPTTAFYAHHSWRSLVFCRKVLCGKTSGR